MKAEHVNNELDGEGSNPALPFIFKSKNLTRNCNSKKELTHAQTIRNIFVGTCAVTRLAASNYIDIPCSWHALKMQKQKSVFHMHAPPL